MARLPNPGSDGGVWGDILNAYLSVSLDSSGELKSGTVGASQIQDGSIADTQLALISQNKIGGLPAALSAKASNSSVVHNTGNETIDGTKTFSSSPIVPTPTNNTEAANKAYVDSVAGVGAPDATVSTKGVIQLAGDLAGTAAAPTVPGLATKEAIITAGTTAQYYRGDKTFQTLDKAAVGLANVDNTSDANKPISTATQTALNAKVKAHGAIAGATKTMVTYDAKGLVTAGADATQDDILDGTTHKQYSATEKAKLAGITSGATVNETDAHLMDRANHTGTQTAGTISDFNTTADARITAAVGSAVQAYSANTTILGNTTSGTGAILRATSPTLITPTLGATQVNGDVSVAQAVSEYLYNTSDQTTNYERGMLGWVSNVMRLQSQVGGTGTVRDVAIASSGAVLTVSGAGVPKISGVYGTTGGATGVSFGGTHNASASSQAIHLINATINQSGTASYAASKMTITESATGSGTKMLADWQVGAVTKFGVSNTGKVTTGGGLTPRLVTVASSAAPTPNSATTDSYTVTALAANATFGAPTGTPDDTQKLLIRIKDNGTARTLAWDAIYRPLGVILPATTYASKILYVLCIYNAADTKWDVVGASQEA